MAAQLLAMLQSMLENLHTSPGGSGGKGAQTPQSKKMAEQMQKLGGLMGKQRDLLDKTFRQRQGQADPKDGGTQGLQKQQSDLEKELQDSLKGMDGKSARKSCARPARRWARPRARWAARTFPMPAAPRTRR